MKSLFKKGFVFLYFLFLVVNFDGSQNFKIELKEKLTLGKNKLFFGSITSVCEDNYNNIYILDRKLNKIFKVSPEGKLIKSFGRKGHGPGDLSAPFKIYIKNNKLLVNEDMVFISIFDLSGKFIKKIKINKGLELHYLNDNFTIAWIWTPKAKKQVLINNKKNSILNSFYSVEKSEFSVNAPDETGRKVMFNYHSDIYTPTILFATNTKYFVLGKSNIYNIKILNHKGKLTATIKRNTQKPDINSKEKKYLSQQIKQEKHLPSFAIKKLIRKIPDAKDFFSKIVASENFIWIFRIPEDITKNKNLIPVELFDLKGDYKGKFNLKEIPIYISDNFFYFKEIDDEDNLLLKKYSYRIIE